MDVEEIIIIMKLLSKEKEKEMLSKVPHYKNFAIDKYTCKYKYVVNI